MTKPVEPVDVSVVAAVRRDLVELDRRQAGLSETALAATALALALEMDAPNSATSKSMCAKALNETMATLFALAPEVVEGDGVDELARKREKRLAG